MRVAPGVPEMVAPTVARTLCVAAIVFLAWGAPASAQVEVAAFGGVGREASFTGQTVGLRGGVGLGAGYHVDVIAGWWSAFVLCAQSPVDDEGWRCSEARSLHAGISRLFGEAGDRFRPRLGVALGVREWSWEPRHARSALLRAGGALRLSDRLALDMELQHHVQAMLHSYDPVTVLAVGLAARLW